MRLAIRMTTLAVLLATCACVQADRIIFHNGRSLDATVISESSDSITFSTSQGSVWTAKREHIARIEREDPGLRWLKIGDSYRDKQMWDDARYAYEQARVYSNVAEEAKARLFEVNMINSVTRSRMQQTEKVESARRLQPPFPALEEEEDTARLSVSAGQASHASRARPGEMQDPILRSIYKHSQTHNLDPLLIRAIVRVESNFNPRAQSNHGAVGLMQLMPATADFLGVENPWDPDANIEAGTRYLRQLEQEWVDAGPAEARRLMLASYFVGLGRIKELGGNIPPGGNIEAYVNRVVREYARLRRLTPEELAIRNPPDRESLARSSR
jgi:soluble lytic murein transglycosylase-like protein